MPCRINTATTGARSPSTALHGQERYRAGCGVQGAECGDSLSAIQCKSPVAEATPIVTTLQSRWDTGGGAYQHV